MEFNRSVQPSAPSRASASMGASAPAGGGGGSKPSKSLHWKQSPMWLRVSWLVLLFSGTILVVAMLALMYFGGGGERSLVDKDKKQAVFLTNGQVYFGNINKINDDFIELRAIYYLNVSQQVQPKDQKANEQQNQSISLVKLGCELHGPVDQMIINRDQVTFWENLKTDGQVSKAVDEWVKQNPDGQKCQTTTTTTDQSKP